MWECIVMIHVRYYLHQQHPLYPFIPLYSRIYTYVHPLYMYIHHMYTSKHL